MKAISVVIGGSLSVVLVESVSCWEGELEKRRVGGGGGGGGREGKGVSGRKRRICPTTPFDLTSDIVDRGGEQGIFTPSPVSSRHRTSLPGPRPNQIWPAPPP